MAILTDFERGELGQACCGCRCGCLLPQVWPRGTPPPFPGQPDADGPAEPALRRAATLDGEHHASAPSREAAITAADPAFAAVLFDMDGSLVDTEPMWFAAEVDLMAGYGSSWTQADQAFAVGGPMDRVGEYIAARLTEQGWAGMTVERVIGELLAAFERHLDAGQIAVHDGADVLLREAMAADVPLALVSNSTRHLMDKVLAAHPDYRFDCTIAGDEVPIAKPHPGPYLEAARQLGVRIEDCLVVEDSPTGVAAARASGAAVVAVAHMGQLEPGPRGIVVPRLDGLSLDGLARQLLR